MSVVTRPAHPALRGCLAGPMAAYDVVLPADAVHLGVPSPCATLILAFDEPLDVGWLAEPTRSSRWWASVSGLHLRPALVRTHGLQRGIQLALTPTGCRALFGLPIGVLAGETIDVAGLPRGLTAGEHDRLAAEPTWPGRLLFLEHVLLRRLDDDAPSRDLSHAWRLLSGGSPVAATAAEVGWSRRRLSTLVRAEFGVTPKQVGRLSRFDRARALVHCGVSLADAAHRSRYADQAHLSREWKELAGRPPSRAGEDFPNLHDVLGGG